VTTVVAGYSAAHS